MSDQEINCHSLFEMGMTVQAKTAGQIVAHPDYNTTTVVSLAASNTRNSA